MLSLNVNQNTPATSRPPVFLLVGLPLHGKTTIRNLICEDTGAKGASCSDAIYNAWSRLSGLPVDDLVRRPKESVRHNLMGLGGWMVGQRDFPGDDFPDVAPDAVQHFLDGGFRRGPTALIQVHLDNGVRALDGIRRPDEFVGAMGNIEREGFRPVVIWVETTRDTLHVKKDSFALTKELTKPEMVIQNDGLLADVRKDHGPALAALYRSLATPQPQTERRVSDAP